MSLFSFNIKKRILFLSLFGIFAINEVTQAQNALGFNGSNSYVEIPYTATNNPAQFTVEFWARVDSGAGTFRSPLSNRNYPPVTGFNFYATPANIWSFSGGSGTGAWSELNGPAVVIGQWTHLAGTYDGTTYRFYVNGVLMNTLVAGFSVNTSRPLRIGAGRTEGEPLYYFPGAVDEVKIWNYARSASQINDNKNVNLALPQTGLMSYYQFEDGTATSKTGSNTGALINAPTTVTGVSHTLAPFITTWQTDGSNNITIPLTGSGYDFTIDWGDGTTEIKTGTPGNISHTYTSSGIKTVSITPNVLTGFPRIYVNNYANRLLLKTIESWGSGIWGAAVDRSFFGASNLEINATDIPDFSITTNFQYMFLYCTSVTGANGFTNWTLNTNPTATVSFSNMFNGATQFNGAISNWDVSRVNTFDNMFSNAQKFNQNIGTWNVANVVSMASMFNNARVFAQDISGWNVANVEIMSSMFQNADAFNIDISGWVVSKVYNMASMFAYSNIFNQDLSNWDVSSVTDMSYMFQSASVFNSPLNWGIKTGNVTNMQRMFAEAPQFNQDIDSWDVSNVTSTNLMFYRTNSFNQSLNSWNVGSLINPSQMFQECTSFNGNVSSWVFTTNPAKNVNATSMFQNTTAFNQNISNWNTERFTTMANMFLNATSFNQNIGTWNVGNVTNMNSMFSNAVVFAQDISGWNVGNVTNMSSMFQNADAFNIDISGWVVSKVTNMASMFAYSNIFNQDLSNWDVSSVTNMSSMFRQMPLFNQLLNWGNKTGNVTIMQEMFRDSPLFNQDIDGWDVSKVTTTSLMFYVATSFNKPLNSWNVGSLVNANSMFGYATSFNQDISTWNISKITNLQNFLLKGKLSRANYDSLLLGWSTLDAGETLVPINLNVHFGNSKYSDTATVLTARNTTLIANKNWTITDDGMNPDAIVPYIISNTLAANNATISITFSENVYRTDVGSGALETTDFLFSLSGGTATLNTTVPSSISAFNNLTFVLGLDINGTLNGAEVLTVTPVLNSIFDVSGNAAATTQSNNTAQLNDLSNPIITGPSSATGLTSSISINENTAVVHTFSANETVNWSKGSTNDGGLFNIDGNGNLVFITAPDYETPSITLNSNTYVVDVIATDAANNATTQTLTITILDIPNSTFGTFATITKQYFTGTHTIVPPTTNNTNAIVYTIDNTAVATVSGSVITFTGVGTANITATQAADANYEGNAVSTLLTVLGKDLVSKYGGISSTNVNYISANGNVGGALGLDKYGKQEYVLDVIVSSGLVMHLNASNTVSYPGTGTNWTDLSGNGNHGTLQNGVAFTSVNNGAMVFDGVNDYFVTNNNLDLSNTDKLTIQIILKTASSNTQMIMEHSVNWNSNNAFGIISNNLSDKIQITDHNQGYNVSNSVASINDNNWHLFTATTDRSLNATDQNLIYIDDNAANKVNVTNLTNDNSGNFASHKLYLSSRGGTAHYFNGAIAQVLIYNRVLTAAEIQQNFNVVKLKYGW